MVSGVFTSEPVKGSGAGRPTYGGRAIEAGTARSGPTWPGASGSRVRRVVVGMAVSLRRWAAPMRDARPRWTLAG
ncbi:hypothetical protein GCM10011331_14660 [Flavimobilis marinus]|nr:hypothetical protein GCM10011331_14660 [Flavimobilis marinus]